MNVRNGTVTVRWDMPDSVNLECNWGANGARPPAAAAAAASTDARAGDFEVVVVAEGVQVAFWRPLLTGGIPTLRRLANKVPHRARARHGPTGTRAAHTRCAQQLGPEDLALVWQIYDADESDSWAPLELRYLFEGALSPSSLFPSAPLLTRRGGGPQTCASCSSATGSWTWAR